MTNDYPSMSRGYTLVELLVSMAIIGLLATLVVFNFRAGEVNRLIGLEANQFVTAVRLAQNNALTGQRFGTVIPGAYGVYVPDDHTVEVYADANNDGARQATEVVQTLTLNPRLQFNNTPINFLFKTYQTINGFCWESLTPCASAGGAGRLEQIITIIQARDDATVTRTIKIIPRTSRLTIE